MCKLDLKTRMFESLIRDVHYIQVKQELQQENIQQKYEGYKLEDNGILTYKTIIFIHNSTKIRKLVMTKIHNVPYAGHP